MIDFSEKVILLPAGAKFWQTGESLSKFIGDKSLDFYEGQLALWCPPRPETKLGPTVTATTTAVKVKPMDVKAKQPVCHSRN